MLSTSRVALLLPPFLVDKDDESITFSCVDIPRKLSGLFSLLVRLAGSKLNFKVD